MLQIQYYKDHRNHHIAHLYEHIFCVGLIKHMQKKDLYHYLDYYIYANTFYSGKILISIDIYNPDTKHIITEYFASQHSYSNEDLSIGLSQLIAESENFYDTTGIVDVSKEIFDLENKAWHNVENINEVSLDNKIKQTKVLAATKKYAKPKILTVSLDYKHDINYDINLFAMFRQIARLINDTVTDYICDQNGYFIEDFYYKQSGFKSAKLVTEIKIPADHEFNIKEAEEQYFSKYNELVKKGAIERFIFTAGESIGNELAPNTITTAESAGILLGKDGWQKLLNINNANKVFADTKLSLKIGKLKIESKLPTINNK